MTWMLSLRDYFADTVLAFRAQVQMSYCYDIELTIC